MDWQTIAREPYGTIAVNTNWKAAGINFDDDGSGYQAKVRFGALFNNEGSVVTANDAIGFGATEAGGASVGAGVVVYSNNRYPMQGTIWVKTAPTPPPPPPPLCCGFILANGIHVSPGTNPPDFPSDCEGTFTQQSDASNGMATYKNGAHWIFYTGSFWTCASSYSATTGLFLKGAAGLDCPSPNSDGTNWKVCTSSGGCTSAVGGNNGNYLMSVTCVPPPPSPPPSIGVRRQLIRLDPAAAIEESIVPPASALSAASGDAIGSAAEAEAVPHHERRKLCHGSCTTGYSVQIDSSQPAWQMCCYADWNRPDSSCPGCDGGCSYLTSTSSFSSLNPSYADQLSVNQNTECCGTPFGQDPVGGSCGDLVYSPPAPPATPWDSCISLNFEPPDTVPPSSTGIECPRGWMCTGAATVYVHPARNGAGAGNLAGTQYFEVGSDSTTGDGTSATFTIPIAATTLKFKRGGGADDGGLKVMRASDDAEICSTADGTNSDTLFENECSLAGYGGTDAYLFVWDYQNSGWGKTYIDDIRFADATDAVIPFSKECEQVWFDSSAYCSSSLMQSFGWTVGASYNGCGANNYYFYNGGDDEGYISIPLPEAFSAFTIEYGQSCYVSDGSVVVKLDGVEVDTIDASCADGTSSAGGCNVYPPPTSCLRTFMSAYSPGAVLEIREKGTSEIGRAHV